MNIRKKAAIGIEIISGLPKTIYFCFKYLPVKQAIKLPIFISSHCKLLELNGKVKIEAKNISTGMILVGIGSVGFISRHHVPSIIELGKDSNICFKGHARFGNGTKISSNGTIIFGNNIIITGDSLILCQKKIEIGDDCLISWHVEIMDTDEHKIIYSDGETNKDAPILIGRHVWIASGCKILKGVSISDANVVAANTIVTSNVDSINAIIGGFPCRVIKKEIRWER